MGLAPQKKKTVSHKTTSKLYDYGRTRKYKAAYLKLKSMQDSGAGISTKRIQNINKQAQKEVKTYYLQQPTQCISTNRV